MRNTIRKSANRYSKKPTKNQARRLRAVRAARFAALKKPKQTKFFGRNGHTKNCDFWKAELCCCGYGEG